MNMGTFEYKRFTELANDFNTFEKFASLSPPPGMNSVEVTQLGRVIEKGQWHKPVPKVSKADAKELPDILLQMEQERDREKKRDTDKDHDSEKAPGTTRNPAATAYLGLRLTHTAADPIEAANVATWLGGYVKDVAASEAVREQVALWKVGNLQFSDRAREQKLKYEFTIEQAQTRAAALKAIAVSYPSRHVEWARKLLMFAKTTKNLFLRRLNWLELSLKLLKFAKRSACLTANLNSKHLFRF